MRAPIASLAMVLVLGLTNLCAQESPPDRGLSAQALFDKGMDYHTGTGFNRDDLKAVDYFRKSAEAGYAPAQVVMAYFLENGIATASDARQAFDWYRKAALQGDRIAEWTLGRYYLAGTVGARDPKEAESWLRKAAEQGDPFGEYLLGVLMEERDYRQAPKWYRAAAEQGLPQAQRHLGLMLKEARGMAPNKPEAYLWLLMAFEAGDESVGGDLNALEVDLGNNLVQQTKDRARMLQQTASRSVAGHGCTGWPGEFDEMPTTPPPKLQRFCR